jgi:hypothetical protein
MLPNDRSLPARNRTTGASCLLEMGLARGIGMPRDMSPREDESYYVAHGKLEVVVRDQVFVSRPSRFKDLVMATAIPVPDNAVRAIERQLGNRRRPCRRFMNSPRSMEASSVDGG